MRNNIFIILLFISTIASAQWYDLTDGAGNRITDGTGNTLVSSGPVTYVTQSEEDNYTILYQWDFEDEDLGLYTEAEVDEDFVIYAADWEDDDSIVSTTINGETTKALKVTMIEGVGHMREGWQMMAYFNDDSTAHEKLCSSRNLWMEPDFECPSGNTKLPGGFGIANTVRDPVLCEAVPGDKNVMHNKMDNAFKFDSYFITWEGYEQCPWSDLMNGGDYYLDSAYLMPGVWNEITECVTINTRTGGTTNADGIYECWVNGDMIFQHDDIAFAERPDTQQFDLGYFAFFTSDPDEDGHTKDSYGLVDNFVFWTPDETDTSFTNGSLHPTDYKMISPVTITGASAEVHADTLFNLASQSPDTLYSDNYPSDMASGNNCAYVVDAGEGHTVTATILDGWLGGDSWIFFYNGNTNNSIMNCREDGYDANLADNFDSGVVTSTGRYLHILLTNSESEFTSNFRIKVEITTP